MIPKNIIQTYKTFDSIPERFKTFIQKIKDLHPDYNYMFYNDEDIEKFMNTNFPHLLSLYNNFKYNIQRIDLFRLLVIYKYGGFYFDIDVEIIKPLDELLDNNLIFPVEFSRDALENIHSNIPKKLYSSYTIIDDNIGQYGFASEPNNDFLMFYISNIENHRIPIEYILNDNKYDILSGEQKQEYVCCTTGPRLLTLIYYEYNNKSKVTLLRNSNNKQMHFGDYGIHHCYQSWI